MTGVFEVEFEPGGGTAVSVRLPAVEPGREQVIAYG